VPIEYPPGVLPFAVAPQLAPSAFSYQTRFIALMVLVDVAAAIGLWRISRQSGSFWGVWLWTIGIPLLGPLVYARLDLVPAAATIWAVERAGSKDWTGAGVFLGLGGLTKIYPALLLPLAFVISPRRRALVIGATIPVVLLLAVFIRELPDLFRQVIVYHTARGLSIESTWGALLLVASKVGYNVDYTFDYGALLVQSRFSSVLKRAGTFLMLCGVAAGVAQLSRAPRGNVEALTNGMFATLTLVVGTAGVFSPQFVIWLIGAAASALCYQSQSSRWTPSYLPASCVAPALVLPIAALTQVLYPFMYGQLIARASFPLLILVVRNTGILVAGILALLITNRTWMQNHTLSR
jgi:hypothetical protein